MLIRSKIMRVSNEISHFNSLWRKHLIGANIEYSQWIIRRVRRTLNFPHTRIHFNRTFTYFYAILNSLQMITKELFTTISQQNANANNRIENGEGSLSLSAVVKTHWRRDHSFHFTSFSWSRDTFHTLIHICIYSLFRTQFLFLSINFVGNLWHKNNIKSFNEVFLHEFKWMITNGQIKK